MIRISHLSKSYGSQVLFQDVSLNIGERDRIGLIGRNGSGKSTFLKMLLDRQDNQLGALHVPEHLVIRSLEQDLNFSEPSALEQVCSALPAQAQHDDWKAKALLMGLGFAEKDFSRAPGDFSSGFQIRLRLAEALVAEPDLLLLDEPTNYLDILSLRWLERFLKNWPKAFILVTHDQHFMEEVITHTVGIHRSRMRKMAGGPQKLLNQIAAEEEVHERTRVNQEKKRKKTEAFIRNFRSGARSAGLVQSRIKSLEKQEVKEKLSKIPRIRFPFRAAEFSGNALLKAHRLCFSYDHHPLIENFSLSINPGDRIAIIGRNGKGKSTLLNLLSENLSPKSGSMKQHMNLQQGYFGNLSKDSLSPQNTILQELRKASSAKEQEIRNLAGALLFSGNASKKKISQLSGGEKNRVCLGKVMLQELHLLFLDEPTNHLDMESCRELIRALKAFAGTVVFVSHDERMLSELATRLVVFDRGHIQVREQSYQDFLEQEGWSEEEDEGIFKKAKGPSDNKKAYLARKEAQKHERQLKKRVQEIEAELEGLSSQQSESHDKLQEAYANSDHEAIKDLGKLSKELSEKEAQLYDELEKIVEAS